jgi:hypothetical protein
LLRVKKLKIEDPIDAHFMKKYEMRKEVLDRDIHPILSCWVNFLMLNNFDFTQERLEAFVSHQLKDKGEIYTEKTASKKVRLFLTKSNLKLLLLTSRSHMIKLVSQFNYIASVQKRCSEKFHKFCDLMDNYDDPLRMVSPSENISSGVGTNTEIGKSKIGVPSQRGGLTGSRRNSKVGQSIFDEGNLGEHTIYEEKDDEKMHQEFEDGLGEKLTVKDAGTVRNTLSKRNSVYGVKPRMQGLSSRAIDETVIIDSKDTALHEIRMQNFKNRNKPAKNEETSPVHAQNLKKLQTKKTVDFDNPQMRSRLKDINKVADDRSCYEKISFENMEELFLEKSDLPTKYVKITDRHDIEIIYESALESFLTCVEELSRLVSYF